MYSQTKEKLSYDANAFTKRLIDIVTSAPSLFDLKF